MLLQYPTEQTLTNGAPNSSGSHDSSPARNTNCSNGSSPFCLKWEFRALFMHEKAFAMCKAQVELVANPHRKKSCVSTSERASRKVGIASGKGRFRRFFYDHSIFHSVSGGKSFPICIRSECGNSFEKGWFLYVPAGSIGVFKQPCALHIVG